MAHMLGEWLWLCLLALIVSLAAGGILIALAGVIQRVVWPWLRRR